MLLVHIFYFILMLLAPIRSEKWTGIFNGTCHTTVCCCPVDSVVINHIGGKHYGTLQIHGHQCEWPSSAAHFNVTGMPGTTFWNITSLGYFKIRLDHKLEVLLEQENGTANCAIVMNLDNTTNTTHVGITTTHVHKNTTTSFGPSSSNTSSATTVTDFTTTPTSHVSSIIHDSILIKIISIMMIPTVLMSLLSAITT